MQKGSNQKYQVIDVRKETSQVTTIFLAWEGGGGASVSKASKKAKSAAPACPDFIPGQYITVYFPELGTPEGKAYSISSEPSGKGFSISVKAIGKFSNRLSALKPGDKIEGSLPYGYFYSESADAPLCLVAAGIGVAPFRSVIRSALIKDSSRPIHLFYGARTLADAAFHDELDTLARKHPSLHVHYFITREEVSGPGIYHGRMDAASIVQAVTAQSLEKTEFFLCGSIPFTRDLWRGLRACGVPEEMICTEAFFSH